MASTPTSGSRGKRFDTYWFRATDLRSVYSSMYIQEVDRGWKWMRARKCECLLEARMDFGGARKREGGLFVKTNWGGGHRFWEERAFSSKAAPCARSLELAGANAGFLHEDCRSCAAIGCPVRQVCTHSQSFSFQRLQCNRYLCRWIINRGCKRRGFLLVPARGAQGGLVHRAPRVPTPSTRRARENGPMRRSGGPLLRDTPVFPWTAERPQPFPSSRAHGLHCAKLSRLPDL